MIGVPPEKHKREAMPVYDTDTARFARLLDAWLMPDDEPEPVLYCDHCDEPIYEGDEVWEYGGEWFCSDECLLDSLRKANVLQRWTADRDMARGWG